MTQEELRHTALLLADLDLKARHYGGKEKPHIRHAAYDKGWIRYRGDYWEVTERGMTWLQEFFPEVRAWIEGARERTVKDLMKIYHQERADKREEYHLEEIRRMAEKQAERPEYGSW